MEKGILLIDKSKGITSFDVIRRLRQKTGVKKMGHAGTLDPNASGLMIIGVGDGTKELSNYIKLDKTYEAEVLLGTKTTTGDIDGEILENVEVRDVSKERTKDVLKEMETVLELPVSVYSAVKKDGEPLYKKVRRGEEVKPPIKKMKVMSATLTGIEEKNGKVYVFVTFDVGSGTYIRSLAEELGRRLGYPATLRNLRRTRIGEYTVVGAQVIE